MENIKETFNKSEHANNANETSHYVLMAVGIAVGLVGIFLRFAGTWTFIDILSNIIFIIGILISLRAVFNILK